MEIEKMVKVIDPAEGTANGGPTEAGGPCTLWDLFEVLQVEADALTGDQALADAIVCEAVEDLRYLIRVGDEVVVQAA